MDARLNFKYNTFPTDLWVITLIIGCILCFSPVVFAQDTLSIDSNGQSIPEYLQKRISFKIENTSLADVLADFSEKYDIYLNYNEDIIPPDHRISLRLENTPVIIVLEKMFEGTLVDIVISQSGQVVLVKSTSASISNPFKKNTLSGFIIDAESGEALIGANIYVENLHSGCVSNVYGFYSLTVPAGYHTFIYSYMGYETKSIMLLLDQNIDKNIELQASILSGDTIVVIAEATENIIESTEIGVIELSPKEISSMPVLFGEQDLLRALQLLPGITTTREGDAGFHVRGGSTDQNLVLLDEAPVYNAFHFFGFFSVFNSDAVKNVKLYKGCAPAKYGGSLSSVLDVQMNEGNYKEFQGHGGIGSIFSRLTLEGPIVKDKSSYTFSARRTYADLFARLFAKNEVKNSSLYFYDFNLKTNYRLSQNDRLYLSGYFGRDVLGFSGVFRNTWGNETATLRWNHIFNSYLFLNTSLVFSNFDYDMRIEPEDGSNDGTVETTNSINAFTIKTDFQYFMNTQNTINFGMQYVLYNFSPGQFRGDGDSPFDLEVGKRNARDLAIYVSHELEVSKALKLNYGLRYSLFMVDRFSDSYFFADMEGVPAIAFRDDEAVNYGGPEPRISVNYAFSNKTSIKLGYARTYQYVHLLSNSTPGTPINVWQPVSSRVNPQQGDQISFGYFQKMANKKYDLSMELFYKVMKNQVDFENGADVILSTLFESDLVFGTGRAYGLELMLRKQTGRLTGWIGYSLSKTRREFAEINSGIPFPVKFDRTHDFSIVMMYKLSPKWTFATNWVYYTGNAITIPYGKYEVSGRVVDAYSPRNAFRMPDYHRLDINFTYTTSGGSTWNFSLYNAYGRRNAYAIVFRNDEPLPVRLSLFSFVPSITYNFNF